MDVYLMQHGLSLSEAEDPERPLSPAGVVQVKASAQGLKALSLSFDLVAASPKRRAQQTAALVAEALRYPYSDILTSESLLPNADPSAVLALLEREPDDSRVLLIGHLPHLPNLAALLCGAPVLFENAGLVGLRRNADGQFALFCLLTRAHLSQLHR